MPIADRGSLWLALGIVTLAGVVLFVVVFMLTGRLKTMSRALVIIVVIGSILGYAHVLDDRAALIRLLPAAGVMVLGVWYIPASFMMAALVLSHRQIPLWRRLLPVVVLLALAYRPVILLLQAKAPECGRNWARTICLQTTSSTCSAATAATLLRYYNVKTTEQEMADLCLTSEKGTRLTGIYRGLRLKTAGLPLRVKADSASLPEFMARKPFPALVNVQLNLQALEREPRYASQWGWKIGMAHSLIILNITGERVEVADPAVGREYWTLQALKDLWKGDYLTVEKVE